jgi:hypothetical protein
MVAFRRILKRVVWRDETHAWVSRGSGSPVWVSPNMAWVRRDPGVSFVGGDGFSAGEGPAVWQ